MNPRLSASLRLPLVWFSLSLLLGSSVFYLALDARMASKTRQITTQAQADAAAHDLRQTPRRLAQDHAQAETYARLRASGFLGEEERLGWLGSLARLRDSLEMRHISWRLAPREASDLSPGLHVSRMEVEINPGDTRRLKPFLEQLRARAPGHFTVHACALRPDAGGHSASCTLDWWTWNGP